MHKRIAIFGGGLLVITAVIFGLLVFDARADSPSSWLESTLSLEQQAAVTSLPASLNGNIDCSADSVNACVMPTAYGSATSAGTVSLNGSPSFYPVISNLENRQRFIAVPNSSTFITYTAEPPFGFYLYFNYNLPASINRVTDPVSGAHYQVSRPPDAALTDKDGHRLAADYLSLSFSQNGQWMVVSEPNVAMLRVNLDTFEVTPFAPGFNYTIGLSPSPQTAISNDGQYAVVTSKAFNRAAIYDLSTCDPTPSTISGSVACQSRDLGSIFSQQIGGFLSANNIRFIDDDSLSLYAAYGQPAAPTIARFLVSDNDSVDQIHYLALGDSYISGEGAFDYQAGTDTDDNKCHLSLVSYPILAGKDLSFDSYHSVACSGAVTNDIMDTGLDYRGQDRGKIKRSDLTDKQISNFKANFLPGYIDQLDFVSTYQPQIVTLSVGGNDMGFADIVQECIEPWRTSTCYATYEDRLELVREIENQVFPRLVTTYQTVKAAGPPGMRLYVVGYPKIAKPGGDCADNVHLNATEVLFSDQLVSYLNSVIKTAATRAGVEYVDVQDALAGHRLCEAKPGSVAVNGLTAGNNIPKIIGGPFGNESYHPNEFGHQLLENAVLSATNNLTDPMPTADASAALPGETNLDILNAPIGNREMNVTEYDNNISAKVLLKQSLNSVVITGSEHSLMPDVSYQAVLHSDPVDLGTFKTDSSGNLSAQVVIPDDVPAGLHEIHFYGQDINGQSIDIYKVVFVGDSPDDLDGDGIPDRQETCVGVAASGQDFDRDDVDDSCDGTISAPPPIQVDAVAETSTQVSAETSTVNLAPNGGTQASQPSSNSRASSKVLAAQTTKKRSMGRPSQLTVVGSQPAPNPRILLAAGGACVWITVCYAAWKFRG